MTAETNPWVQLLRAGELLDQAGNEAPLRACELVGDAIRVLQDAEQRIARQIDE